MEHAAILKGRRVDAERLAVVCLKSIHVVEGVVIDRACHGARVARVAVDDVQLRSLLRLPVECAVLCSARERALQPGRPTK